MPSTEPDVKVEKDRLLLVEGKDEVNLFSRIALNASITDLQVIDLAGKNNLPDNLPAILSDARTRGIHLKTVGVARDADADPQAAFESVCSALRSAGLMAPTSPMVLGSGDPAVAVMIVPAEDEQGSVEQLCWRTIDYPLADCVDAYLKCLQQVGELRSSNHFKTRVHAYLASRQDPTTSVGLGASHGYWQLEHAAFDIIRNFMTLLRK